jgi:hypothetical protein
MVNIFKPLVDIQDGQFKSQSWYRNAASLITDKSSANALMRSGKLIGRPSGGRMNLFFYDPKTKGKLPFYDIFPLVLPIDTFPGGFIGLNFHYLPYGARYKFLSELQRYASNGKFDKSTRLQVSYDDIKSVGFTKAAIKKYLYKQVRSNFLRVNTDEMAIAINLPVAQFKGASLGKVFANSRSKY